MSPVSSINALTSLITEVGFPKLDDAGKDPAHLDVSGDVVDYREGDDSFLGVRSLPHGRGVDDVTLQRGLVDASSLFTWLSEVRNSAPPAQQRGPSQSWTLNEAKPHRYDGPSLNSKSGADTAMEELILSQQGIEISRKP